MDTQWSGDSRAKAHYSFAMGERGLSVDLGSPPLCIAKSQIKISSAESAT
jgi:hypothetical protein